MQNNSITSKIRPVVVELDNFFSNPSIFKKLTTISKELLPEISAEQPYAVRDVSTREFGENLPGEVGSIRVAVFFPNEETKIERHPNSTQFLFSIDGSGETRVLRDQKWEKDVYGENYEASLDSRWHYVEKNAWHQSVAVGNKPWTLVAIHTATDVQDEYQID
ncbi:hypothetical protein GTQ40_03315 [Flavobacteriaceae bacterium R38]|nr:hypothetical protein [Flavobacteriaceae bacterium R38]